MTVAPLTAMVEAHAVAALRNITLRGSDALHFGSALAARVDLFVTPELRLAEAAKHCGLTTELIQA